MRTVLWTTQVYPRTPEDPLGSFLHRLARELPARGWDPVVLAPAADGLPAAETIDGVRVVRFPYAPEGRQDLAYTGEMHRAALRAPGRMLGFLRAFRKAVGRSIETEQPAVIHAHWWVPTGWATSGPAGRAGIPWVLSLHGTDVRLARRLPLVRPLARRVVGRAARVLPVSSALARWVEEQRFRGVDVDVLPMPADAGVFSPPDPSSVAESADDRPPVFIVAARLIAQKRIGIAIEAFARASSRIPGAVLEIAGDGPERSRLEAHAASIGVGDRVRFAGMLSPAELAERFRRATGVVVTSEEEGYGLTLIEGALCGTPAVAVRSGGPADLVEDGVSGLLVPPGDVAELAEAFVRLGHDPGLRDRLGKTARERALAGTAAPLADRLAGVYDAVAGGASRP